MPSSINLTRLLQSTLAELEKNEDLKSNPKAGGDLRNSILRTMAELEVAKSTRADGQHLHDAQHLHLVSSPEAQPDQEEQDSSAVA